MKIYITQQYCVADYSYSVFKPTGTLKIALTKSNAGYEKCIQTTPLGQFGSVNLFENWLAGCAQICLYSWNKLCQTVGQASV